MDKDIATSDEAEAEGYPRYSVEEVGGPQVSAAFKAAAEHLHLTLPPGLGVATVGLTRRRHGL